VVLVQNVSKLYRLYQRPSDRIRELISFPSRKLHTDFWALQDIHFEVEKGETFGIVGPNGCGKSTLLQIVSGILQPSSGRVVTGRRVAALLELGAGFNPDFTGRENVFLNGEIMGLSRTEIERALPSIAAFAEIGALLERPVKEYSSGMYVRLAFATAIHVEPDVLIVDEALAVGDAIFANRCVRKFEELRRRKVTVLFVSHDLGLVKQLSGRAMLLLNGRMHTIGEPAQVINQYIGLVLEKQRADAGQTPKSRMAAGFRHGDGTSEILDVRLLDGHGEPTDLVAAGDPVCVCVRSVFRHPKADPMVGILIRNRIGMDVYGTNTKVEQIELGSYEPGDQLDLEFRFECRLAPQQYTLTVATQNADGSSHDWLDDVLAFEVMNTRAIAGVTDLRAQVSWEKKSMRERALP
jgi:ABC-type polysaccharide/polyol phosphate transport system ATPase subunit